MSNKIYIYSPLVNSGGPENLQQLCYVLRNAGYDSSIVYQNKSTSHLDEFQIYGNPISTTIEDAESSILVIPESYNIVDEFFSQFKKLKKVMFWMSVDNSFVYNSTDAIFLENRVFEQNNIFCHLYQCNYIYRYLKSRKIDNLFPLSDYINDIYIDTPCTSSERKRQVLFNPRKGFNFTKELIACNTDINFISICNMSREQIIHLMDESMLYIDFGHHPGKDRMPREAALRGLVVMTGRSGSAANMFDVPVPDEFKFDTSLNSLPDISSKMHACLDYYNLESLKMKDYVETIKKEKSLFEFNAKWIFKKICE